MIASVARQVFVDGLVHADPHPGNFLVAADGRIAVLDFGCMLAARCLRPGAATPACSAGCSAATPPGPPPSSRRWASPASRPAWSRWPS